MEENYFNLAMLLLGIQFYIQNLIGFGPMASSMNEFLHLMLKYLNEKATIFLGSRDFEGSIILDPQEFESVADIYNETEIVVCCTLLNKILG